jgi:DNA-binding beta-propeller fold protein YncE
MGRALRMRVFGLGFAVAVGTMASPALALVIGDLDLDQAFAFSTSAIPCTGGVSCAGGIVSFAPEGLAYNPSTDTLLVTGEFGSGMLVYELNLDGTFTDPANPSRFQLSGAWRGLDFLAGGTLLASQEFGLIQEYNLDGTVVAGGISFTATGAQDAEGVVLGPDGAVYVADDGNETIRRFTGSGSTWTEDTAGAFPIGTRGIATSFDDPSGIEILPKGGGLFNLLVHDDSSGAFGGVWEVTLAGVLVDGVVDSKLLTANVPGCTEIGGCYDGEGLAYDDANGVFFIAYEGDQKIISYPRAPEPSIAGMLLLALGGLARRLRS